MPVARREPERQQLLPSFATAPPRPGRPRGCGRTRPASQQDPGSPSATGPPARASRRLVKRYLALRYGGCSRRTHSLRDQLGLDDEENSEIADGGATGSCLPGGTSVGDFPTSSVSAVQLVPQTMCSARTPPVGDADGNTIPYTLLFI